jgi:hypothetical protein
MRLPRHSAGNHLQRNLAVFMATVLVMVRIALFQQIALFIPSHILRSMASINICAYLHHRISEKANGPQSRTFD